MSKVTVKTKWAVSQLVDGFVDDSLTDDIGAAIRDGMKEAMSVGLSPVEGVGRFEAYKNPDKYPGGKKPKRPVNLFLSGALYKSIEWYRSGRTVVVGIFDSKVAEYAKAHQDGTDHMARRQIFPEAGESFLVSIQRKILALYTERMSDIINKSNR